MIVVLGDLLADLALHIPSFPIDAQDMFPLEFVDLGPGGACNVAIMGARFGLRIRCLGELGQDRLGDIVVEGLQAEGINTASIIRSPDGATPLAGVVVDQSGEPAYLGFGGSLRMQELPDAWSPLIETAEALFADGWVEHRSGGQMLLTAFTIASSAGVPVFFDPGPGNPRVDNDWQRAALSRTDVLLLNEAEARRLAGNHDPAAALLEHGPQLVMIKRGGAGVLAADRHQQLSLDAYPVQVLDSTGAGDSFDAAVIYGHLRGLPLRESAKLANATGAAKVGKRGTGRNLPQLSEVAQVLQAAGDRIVGWDPTL